MATKGAQTTAMQTTEVAEAYREFGRQVMRRCRRILRDASAAEDATQEVFLKLWRYGQSFRVAECKLGWLYRVADHCCFNELRRRKTRREQPEAAERAVAAPAREVAEDRQLASRLLARLPERVQQVAILHYVEQMTQDEIAAATGWSRQTIHKKLQLVRQRAASYRSRWLGEAA
jgi:RNA polymerase sigma-70 factor (ECF subfamily)